MNSDFNAEKVHHAIDLLNIFKRSFSLLRNTRQRHRKKTSLAFKVRPGTEIMFNVVKENHEHIQGF